MRVVVVGCGALGAASALALAGVGHDVTVVERIGPANTYGSSHGGARIFRVAYDEPDYVELARRALPRWRAIEDAAGVALLTTTGCVDHGDAASVGAVREAVGDGEMLTASEAARRWPGLRFDGDVHHDPDGGRLDAAAAVWAMARLAVAAGATLVPQRVLEVTADRVSTAVATHEADAVVVTAGAWTSKLTDGFPPPVVTLEQPLHVAARGDGDWPSFIHHREGEPFVYGLNEPGAGVKVGEHGTGRAVDPDDLDRTPDPEAAARLADYAAEWLPGADASTARATGCLYDTTPTHDFVIDRLPSGVIAAAGTSGHGFKFAPELGRLVAALVDGEPPHPRFALGGESLPPAA